MTLTNDECGPDSNDVQYQFMINGEMFPVMPVRSRGEAWTQLMKAIGIHNSAQHSVSITDAGYQTQDHIIGFDAETVIGASLTGRNLRNGPSQLSIQLKNLTQGGTIAASDSNAITKVFFCLCYDVVMEIRDSGITILC
jgi:hypothetical protein